MKSRSVVTSGLIAVVSAVIPQLGYASPWEIDGAHVSAGFSVRHLGVSNVRGEFRKVAGTINFDDQDLSKSTVEATIDTSTIDTHEPKRDAHLKSPDFLDVAKYPTITFKSTSVKKRSATKLAVTGNLTLHGVTKPVTLDVELTAPLKTPFGDVRRGVQASTKLSRKEYGLVWNKMLEGGGLLVGDEVAVTIDFEAIQKEAKEAKK